MVLMNGNEVVTPDDAEAALAKKSGPALAAHLESASGVRLEVRTNGTAPGEELIVPVSAARLLARILSAMAQGHSVSVTPLTPEITTQQAADLLNVSRPYLVKLVDDGTIPSRKVGAQRRLMLDDVVAYKKAMYAKSELGLDELAALDQELGLYRP
jgi:excisionase family DNA binding protein